MSKVTISAAVRMFPEINGLSLSEAVEARRLGVLNLASVSPEAVSELNDRITALNDRIRRLRATQRAIDRATLALKRNR
jgi:uncharacterized small protein (DUF1192 family)